MESECMNLFLGEQYIIMEINHKPTSKFSRSALVSHETQLKCTYSHMNEIPNKYSDHSKPVTSSTHNVRLLTSLYCEFLYIHKTFENNQSAKNKYFMIKVNTNSKNDNTNFIYGAD